MNTNKIYAESIANEYSVKTDSKVVALRKLDKKVKSVPKITAYVVGIVSTLILGTGMCLVMNVIGNGAMAAGVIIGVLGILGVSVNYPIYKRSLTKRKTEYAGDIIRLAGETTSET